MIDMFVGLIFMKLEMAIKFDQLKIKWVGVTLNNNDCVCSHAEFEHSKH